MLDAYNAAQRKVDEQNDIKNVLEYTSNVADLKHAIGKARESRHGGGMERDADNGLRRLKELHVREMSNARLVTRLAYISVPVVGVTLIMHISN